MLKKLTRLVATLCVAGPVAAQDAGHDVHLTKSVQTFQQLCLQPAPALPKDPAVFASRGYVKPTRDTAVFGNAQGGFAGIGFAGMEGGASSSKKPNGCLVYFKGLNATRAAALTDAAMRKRFKFVERKQVNGDHYWIIQDFAPRMFLAFVAPKTTGTYSGHTLLMITEQSPPASTTRKTPAAIPEDRQQASKVIEDLKNASPEERLAFFGGLQFSQCLLANNFLQIEFDKEIGVERVPSSRSGENRFADSTTGNIMLTNATQCAVVYRGTNVDTSLAGIAPLITMRDKNAKTIAYRGGYLIKLMFDGKPHVITIVRGRVQGHKAVRMMLMPQRAR